MTLHDTQQNEAGLLLPGLDGGNPLGFLAAMGTLRTVQRVATSGWIRLCWEVCDARYVPRLFGAMQTENELISLLRSGLTSEAGSPWNLSRKLPFEADRLREAARHAATTASIDEREQADGCSSFGSAAFVDDKGQFADTALRMVRSGDSAGQGLLDYAQKIRGSTAEEDLRHALFEQWRYSASGPSLRWDPAEAREYALLASDPSKDGALSVIGANRLALEAMPLFTTCPIGAGLATLSFHQSRSKSAMSWPMWTVPLTLALIQSVITLDELSAERPSAKELKPRGIAAVFRSQLFKPNQYYSNFTPARAVMA